MYNWDDHARRIQSYIDRAIGKALGAVGINQRTIDADVLRGELDSSIVLPAHAPEHEDGGADEIDLGALAGTLVVGQFGTQTANRFPGGPASGVPGAVSWRALVAADIPELAASKITGVAVTGGGNGAANRVAIWTDANTLDDDSLLAWDSTNKRLGVGTASPLVRVHFRHDTDADFIVRAQNADANTFARVMYQLTNDTANAYFILTGSGYTQVAGWGNRFLINTDVGITGGILLRAGAGGVQISANGTNNANVYVSSSNGFVAFGHTSPANRIDIDQGAMRYAEMTAPAAPAANAVVLFARDDGAGVTEWCARFSSGDIIPIARQGITIPTYTITNVTTDRSFDADTVAIAELADAFGTLIADLRAQGIVK